MCHDFGIPSLSKRRPFDEKIKKNNPCHTPRYRVGLKALRLLHLNMAEVDRQLILENVGPVQAVLDAHDGVVNVIDTTDGIIMIGLEGGCTGCSSTPMTAMQIYYSLMKLEQVNDVVFVNGELPAYMRAFIDDKLKSEA
ncbi:MAG: hypothetical protein Ct9H90mP16_18880 [Candidatus Poseidoniales archaeon]|nr:MAG: hypothetical protein Ct9H90mP16_18880 [Candidatus Poseidoniales archaeon]